VRPDNQFVRKNVSLLGIKCTSIFIEIRIVFFKKTMYK
jgi:hypothetical protein